MNTNYQKAESNSQQTQIIKKYVKYIAMVLKKTPNSEVLEEL